MMAGLHKLGEGRDDGKNMGFTWHGDDDELLGWLVVPIGRNRDSDLLTVSNHEAGVELLKAAEPEGGDDYRVVHMGHWGCGWVDYVVVRPGSKCAEVGQELADRLEDCPVLDEEDYSRRQDEDMLRSWDDYGAGDFRKRLAKALPLLTDEEAERLDECDKDQLREFYLDHAGVPYEFDGSGCYFPESQLRYFNYENVREFLAGPPKPERTDQPRLFDVS